jgi:hypothetical protein
MLPKEFIEFLKTCSDMELVTLQNEARNNFDKPTFRAVMSELGRRTNKGIQVKKTDAGYYCPKGHLLYSNGMCGRCEEYFPIKT